MSSSADSDAALTRVMTQSALRITSQLERSYDVCIEAASTLVRSDLAVQATHGGSAYILWIQASDIYDTPEGNLTGEERTGRLDTYADQFSRDWLDIDADDDLAVADYFRRWLI